MTNQKNQEEAIKNLETQVGTLAKKIAMNQSSSSFSANTQVNPKEHCKAVVTRTGPKGSNTKVEINGCEDETKIEDENQRKEDEEDEIIEGEAEKETTKKKKEEMEIRNKSRRKSANEKNGG